jgi:aryl-alcohol dehydrogenase-like predicted oxidoreductase
VLGSAIKGRRDKIIVSTKSTLRMGAGANDIGASRHRLIESVDKALKRLDSDYIDIFQLHHFDAMTPIESVMATLDDLIKVGKIRYTGVSNFSGWQVMKSQAIADRYGYNRFIANQTYYSLLGRDYEWELMPLGIDQGLGAIVWSPLGWGRLTGKISRTKPIPAQSRLHETAQFAPPVTDEHLYAVIDEMEEIAMETGKSLPQIALNWVLYRPTVSSVLIGARNESQLKDNIQALGWRLTEDQVKRLDQVSQTKIPYPYYPYWNGQFSERNPPAC